jgi:uncharacterized protein YprB with RNaseH-like and TPR domain
MNLRERLRSMQGIAAPPAADIMPVGGAPPAADVVDQTDSAPPPVSVPPVPPVALRSRHGLESLLPGEERQTIYGPCFVVEWRYSLAHRHGAAPLGAALAVGALGERLCDAAVLLARSPGERAALLAADPRRFVYLDTETTGLAGGTGTYAFLVGVARFVDDALVVRQLFMRELSEEHALLHLLAEELGACEVLVTYNGKAFDWPLLETRFALGRRAGPRRPPDPAVHVDLLFAARRLWRARLESCSLGHVEHHLLGVHRGEDTPGWLIPQLYFTYLRSGDPRPLAGVFRHNALDLLSLAALLGRVAALRGAPADARAFDCDGVPGGPHDADELLALGRGFDEAGEPERALACYRVAAHGGGLASMALRAAVTREALTRSGALLKRLRRHAEAAAHWEALLRMPALRPASADVRPYEELAMYCEHVARDHRAARAYARQALDTLAAAGASATRERARLLHRLARLERLMAAVEHADA